MQYKTIVLELIREIPSLHDRLTSNKTLLSTMNQVAVQLRDLHLERIADHLQRLPHISSEQRSSETLEQAIAEIKAELNAM